MPKTLALVSRSNVNEHWYTCNPYSESDIKAIKDPAGLTDRKQITSIPSPFARVDLFKSAFAHLVDSARNDTYQLDGSTIYHKLVSDCLDTIELLFNMDVFKEDPDKHIKLITWNRTSQLRALMESSNPGHRILGETMKLFFEQDKEAYNFDKLENFYLIEYDFKVIGGTSPATLAFTTANDMSFVDLKIGSDKFYDYDYCPLYERDAEFQRYLHLLFKFESRLSSEMVEVQDYLELNLQHLNTFNRELYTQIQTDLRTIEQREFVRMYPELDTGIAGQVVQVIGVQMRKKRIEKGAIQDESDFVIKSPKFAEKNPDALRPLALQNNFAKPNFRYVKGGKWEANTPVPYKYPTDIALDKRLLPNQNESYPHLTVDDFLEPYLMKMVYPLNDEAFFNGNTGGFQQNSEGYLLPIRLEYFKYFDIKDLKSGRTMSGLPFFEMQSRVGGGVAVTLRIPIVKEGEYITFERIYYPDTQPKITETENKGAVLECQFGTAIFPFVKLPADAGVPNMYRVMLIDRDIKETTKRYNYELKFFKEQDLRNPIDATAKERSNKANNDDATSKFYLLEDSFDLITVSNTQGKALMIPLFKTQNLGTQGFTFAVDFGTTNSHIEYRIEGGRPLPFEITEDDTQYATSWRPDYQIIKAPEIEILMLKEFLPKVINDKSEYKFPFRTTISEKHELNHNQSVHALADLNIPFYYEKEMERRNTRIFREIKWSNYALDHSAQNRVEKFLENLIFMMRNKVILNQGSLSKTKLVWFYPSSMTPTRRDKLENMWMDLFEKYFPQNIGRVEDKVLKMSESVAPFYHYKNNERVSASAFPVVSIDIGGGTTDIVVFAENRPAFVTSFHFAGNAIFGDAYSGSPRTNGFVRRYKNRVETILQDNILIDLMQVLNRIKDSNSQEIASFFFSLSGNKDVKDRNIKLSFSQMLSDDEELKIIFLVFYGAIIYHIAKLMKKANLELPRYICFSGNGSKSINIIDGSRGLRRLTDLCQLIFEEVYKQDEAKKPEEERDNFKYGARRQADRLEIKQVGNPKEVTCKGGLAEYIDDTEIERLKLVLLGTPNDDLVNVESDKFEINDMRYKEITKDHHFDVAEEVKHFIDLFFGLHKRYNFSRNFGVNLRKIEEYKRILSLDLLQYLKDGLEQKERKDLGGDMNTEVEESLFFYPLVGALNNLATHIAEESVQN